MCAIYGEPTAVAWHPMIDKQKVSLTLIKTVADTFYSIQFLAPDTLFLLAL